MSFLFVFYAGEAGTPDRRASWSGPVPLLRSQLSAYPAAGSRMKSDFITAQASRWTSVRDRSPVAGASARAVQACAHDLRGWLSTLYGVRSKAKRRILGEALSGQWYVAIDGHSIGRNEVWLKVGR